MKRFIFSPFFVGYIFLLAVYTLWSFTLTDPNLVLTAWTPYWSFQNWLWSLDKHHVTGVYVILITALFFLYFQLFRKIRSNNAFQFKNLGIREIVFIIAICVFPLLFSYNALSHDVFNYIFNAKMVVEYRANPHIQTALEYSHDEWVRFMHNVHTPAPYWYGWTILSLIPYLGGLGKFVTTWLVFRLWSVLGLVLLIIFQWKLLEKNGQSQRKLSSLVLFVLNPLILIEIISNSHNDAWMMWPALASIYILMKEQSLDIQKAWKMIIVSFGLLVFSLSIKIATMLLIPFWIYLVIRETALFTKLWKHTKNIWIKGESLKSWIDDHLFDLMSLTMFLPLLTVRAQQFHPWYLLWPLSFLPFLELKWWRNALLILSVSSLFRYVPWMWAGAFEFTSTIQVHQKLITWIPFIIFLAGVAAHTVIAFNRKRQ